MYEDGEVLRRLFLFFKNVLSVSPGGWLTHRPVMKMAPPAWFQHGVLGAAAGVSVGDKGQHRQQWSWCEGCGAKLESWIKMLTRTEVSRAPGWRIPQNDRVLVLGKMLKTEKLDLGNARKGL